MNHNHLIHVHNIITLTSYSHHRHLGILISSLVRMTLPHPRHCKGLTASHLDIQQRLRVDMSLIHFNYPETGCSFDFSTFQLTDLPMQLASTSESRHGECRWPTHWRPPQAAKRRVDEAANGHSPWPKGVQFVWTLWISLSMPFPF